MAGSHVTRTEILAHVEGAFGFQALGREDIVDQARRTDARPEVIATLGRLPNDRPYTNVRDIWAHLEDVPVSA
ncbi:MAG: DUF2795 domain-containing protein [Coriobacteriia bacterium]|nr:DUF2795 domain-containing protein [Coriobacteriia bacterium]